jgi:dTDP-4-dehydrorhamnose reductase
LIWLVGNKGMLGTELALLLAERGAEFFGTDRERDITDPEALGEGLEGLGIDWIVNCSAYTAVDRAEDEEEAARAINARGAANLAAFASRLGARFVHLSTDYVFSGEGDRPYLEDDPAAPAGAYGRTKAEGESLVRSACERHFIVRTAWLYGRHGKNFVYTMLKAMRDREEVGIVTDQRGNPTWARDLAESILRIALSGTEAYGTYHFTNRGETTWYEFAAEIQRLGLAAGLLQREARLKPLTSDQYPAKVKRPRYSVLGKEKISRVFGIEPPEWRESLRTFIEGIAKDGCPLL